MSIVSSRTPSASPPVAMPTTSAPANAADQDDAALVARCLRGDGDAWAALVRRYQRLVYAVVRRIGFDEHGAADVFQTVFSRLVEHLPRIAEPQRLQAWIVTTAKREALLQRSRALRHVSMTASSDDAEDESAVEWDVADDSPLPDELLDDLQQAVRVRRALDRLDERSRTLLLMLFDDRDGGPKYAEIASRLGTPIGSIGPTRARCLAKLRALLD